MLMDYYEAKKKKKKKSSDGQPNKSKHQQRNLKIIDDDIDLKSLHKSGADADGLADLFDADGPVIAEYIDETNSASTSKKTTKEVATSAAAAAAALKWKKIDLKEEFEDFDDDDRRKKKKNDDEYSGGGSDLDSVPRRRKEFKANVDSDGDLSPVRRRNKSGDDDGNGEDDELRLAQTTRVRKRRVVNEKEEALKKAKQAEKQQKYMEWGKGLVQKKHQEEKLKDQLHEAEKPLARYKDDKDLDALLKDKEREEDPMLEYIRKSKSSSSPSLSGGADGSSLKPKAVYRGPPPPPNRYNLMPGARWDGVDRSNGFEKRYFDSIVAKKARDEEAYKWSVEDM